ncbi:hypothetical protein KP509_05G002800 [Ceratopteris richardii]|uniref:Uncharacterized protein n=1 Tax=Ceratopteris richardii TaxID=49495 RepID=A0A8T2UN12_CERRI|nr:hypothetical protein KP509_05G002800 [Ceratopteris richardii]
MQFEWHELLKEKLGFSWQVRTEDFFVEHACNTGNVVKKWSMHERSLLSALKIEQSSVRALNVDDFDGYACLVKVDGDISLWDIINRACINKVCRKGGVISAISRKTESRFAVAGGSDSLNVWDFRCPVLMPLFRMTADWQSHQTLHFDDYEVFIQQPQCYQQLYDVRKPQSGFLSSMPAASVMGQSSIGERADQTFRMWERLTFSDEEESWDDPVIGHNGASPEKCYSFTMRCATIVRSLSS